MQPSSVSTTQKRGNILTFVSKFSDFAFDSRFNNLNSDGHSSSVLSNNLYFGLGSFVVESKPRSVVSLNLTTLSASNTRKLFNEFNRAVKFHCEKIPIGFASLRIGSEDYNGLRGDGCDVLEDEGLHLNGVEPSSPKKVLILMSDTGGGHRASAESIEAAFSQEFGDEYQVFIIDLWTDHALWPFNQLRRSYSVGTQQMTH